MSARPQRLRLLSPLLAMVLLTSSCALLVRTSTSSSGGALNQASSGVELSGSGRFAVFETADPTVAGTDTNGTTDVFLRDHQAGTTELISVATGGTSGNGASFGADISADGRYVVFSSSASDLVTGDTNGAIDVFLRDRQLGVTERVSQGNLGQEPNGDTFDPSVSDDGQFVAYVSLASNIGGVDNNGVADVIVHDRILGAPTLISFNHVVPFPADDASTDAVIAADGSTVVYRSQATNLVAGDTNGVADVFAWDRVANVNQLVSVPDGGGLGNGDSERPDVSADGQHVAFESIASNMAPTDTEVLRDIFVRDVQGGTTEQISTTPTGQSAGGTSANPSISGDGSRVAFESTGTDLVADDTNGDEDVFVYADGSIERVSVGAVLPTGSVQANGESSEASLSDDGRAVAFKTIATNVLTDDTNLVADIATRAARRPVVDLTAGSLVRGETRRLRFEGNSFPDNLTVSIGGNGVTSVSTFSLSPTLMEVDVTLSATADTGQRNVWLIDPLTALFGLPLGAGALVTVDAGTVTVISDPPAGSPDGTVLATGSAMADDGDYAVFTSTSSNLVAGDTNGVADVFRRHVATGVIELVSVDGAGQQSADPAGLAETSADGRYVVYVTEETNASNSDYTVYLKDMDTGTLTTVAGPYCFSTTVKPNVDISGDGNYVVLDPPASGCASLNRKVNRWHRVTGTATTISPPPSQFVGGSHTPRIDHDGDHVAFVTDWVYGQFLRLYEGGTVTDILPGSVLFIPYVDIDHDGDHIALGVISSGSDREVRVYDTNAGTYTANLSLPGGEPEWVTISDDGAWVGFDEDTGGIPYAAGAIFPEWSGHLVNLGTGGLERMPGFAPAAGGTGACTLLHANGDLLLFDRDGTCGS